jgi:hypothetical protein
MTPGRLGGSELPFWMPDSLFHIPSWADPRLTDMAVSWATGVERRTPASVRHFRGASRLRSRGKSVPPRDWSARRSRRSRCAADLSRHRSRNEHTSRRSDPHSHASGRNLDSTGDAPDGKPECPCVPPEWDAHPLIGCGSPGCSVVAIRLSLHARGQLRRLPRGETRGRIRSGPAFRRPVFVAPE